MAAIVLFLFLVSIRSDGFTLKQTCDNITCFDSHSYCDKDNICRCKPEYPVHIELQSCRQGKKYNEECDFNAECYYYDINSICCSQFGYNSTCKCKNGSFYNKYMERCIIGKKYNEKCDFNEECYYYDKNSHCPNPGHLYKSYCKCDDAFYYDEPRKKCMKGKKYNEKCDFNEECYHYDKNSHCPNPGHLYKSYCKCDDAFYYSESRKRCMEVYGDNPKTSYLVSPTSFGLFFAFASIACGGFLFWYVCKRPNGANTTFSRNRRTSLSYRDSDRSVLPTAPTLEETLPSLNYDNTAFSRNRMTSQSNYLTSGQGHQRSVCIPNAPTLEEPLPTYDTALSLKVDEVCGPPPSYKEVFSQESNSKR